MSKKVSYLEMKNFVDRVNHNEVSNQRLGQAFCNEFHIQDAILFHEEKNGSAIKRIWERYVE